MTEGPKQASPVDWYDPRQLFRTGIEVLTTSLFGQRADSRRLSALGFKEPAYEAPATPGKALWVDFAADTGDGFAATFAVARALAADLRVTLPGGELERLPSGHVLILGGDQVYPTPTGGGYEARFLGPFQHARPAGLATAAVDLYAVPGNHDWYDGLVEFSRVFCTGSKIGPWQTRQRRSYFAIRLSERLWLFALDTQVCQDIDRDQLEYFRGLTSEWREGDCAPPQVIVVTAEPYWETVDYAPKRTPRVQRIDIFRGARPFLLGMLLSELEAMQAEVVLQLTGDLHHYRRYATKDGRRHLVTAGGGGAFLHPTHTRVAADPERPFRDERGQAQSEAYHWQGADFPDPRTSRRLALGDLGFALKNPRFVALLGVVYLLLALVMPRPEAPSLLSLPWEALKNLLVHTTSAFTFGAIMFGVVAFTDTVDKRYRIVAGVLHALAHLSLALVLAWSLRHLRVDAPRSGSVALDALARHLGFCGLMVGAGGAIGACVWGAYLYVSVNWFGRHSNEAFSALRCQDFKCFVRMRLTPNTLTVYPLGLRETPRKWRWDERLQTWTPEREPAWQLIEPPFSIALKARASERALASAE